MLEVQMEVLRLWYAAADRLSAAQRRVADDRDRGEITSTTALIFLLVVAAIGVGGIITAKIISNANNIPDP